MNMTNKDSTNKNSVLDAVMFTVSSVRPITSAVKSVSCLNIVLRCAEIRYSLYKKKIPMTAYFEGLDQSVSQV